MKIKLVLLEERCLIKIEKGENTMYLQFRIYFFINNSYTPSAQREGESSRSTQTNKR
jgi:hypothetical protein